MGHDSDSYEEFSEAAEFDWLRRPRSLDLEEDTV